MHYSVCGDCASPLRNKRALGSSSRKYRDASLRHGSRQEAGSTESQSKQLVIESAAVIGDSEGICNDPCEALIDMLQA